MPAEVEYIVHVIERIGSMRDQHHGPAFASVKSICQHFVRRGGVKVGGGLIEHEHGLISQHRTRNRETRPLSAGDVGTAIADSGVEAVGQALQPGTEAARRSATSTSSSVADGRASRTFSTTDEANTCGSSSTRPHGRGGPRSSAISRASTPSRTRRPTRGSMKRISSAAKVDLPAAARSDDADSAPRRQIEFHVDQHVTRTPAGTDMLHGYRRSWGDAAG